MPRKKNKQAKGNQKAQSAQAKAVVSQVLPPKQADIFKGILKLYEGKQYKKAIKAADSLLKTHPEHGETLAMKGLIKNAMGEQEEAMKLVQEGLKHNMTSHVCWHVYGSIYASKQNYAEAIKCYQRALKFKKDNLQIMKDLAQLQIQRRFLPGYAETRRKMLVLKSDVKTNWTAYAIGSHLAGNHTKALSILDSFQKNQDQSTLSFVERSELHLYKNMIIRESGDSKRALAHLEEIKSFLKDPISEREIRGSLLMEAGKHAQAAIEYRALLKINPENYNHHMALRRAMKLQPEDGKYTGEQVDGLKQLYQKLSNKYPKCTAIKRLPLDFLSGDEFTTAVDKYLRPSLIKGVPSLFRDLRPLYADADKARIIEETFLKYLTNLRASSKFAADDEDWQSPAALLWTLYYAGHHYDHLANPAKALEMVNEAIEHTPTTIDAYVLKARIYKHAGDPYTAFAFMNKARKLDLADRYLNTKCTRYALRAGKIADAHRIVKLFLREPAELSSLYDMQCCWYELCAGDSYAAQGDLKNALTKYVAVDNHFDEITEDQQDFHSYCLRKNTLVPYVDMIRFQDTLRSHRYYFQGAVKIIKHYLAFFDNPSGAPLARKVCDMNPEERKAAEETRTAAHQKATEQRIEDAKFRRPNKKQGNPLEKDPLKECARVLAHLSATSGDKVETHLCAFEIARRENKALIMLKNIKKARAADPDSPAVHVATVDFLQHCLLADPASLGLAVIATAVKKECGTIQDGKSVAEMNQAFADKHATSLPHRLAAAQVRARLGEVAEAQAFVADISGCENADLKSCRAVLDWLGDCKQAAACRTQVQELFPYAVLGKFDALFGFHKVSDAKFLEEQYGYAEKSAILISEYCRNVEPNSSMDREDGDCFCDECGGIVDEDEVL